MPSAAARANRSDPRPPTLASAVHIRDPPHRTEAGDRGGDARLFYALLAGPKMLRPRTTAHIEDPDLALDLIKRAGTARRSSALWPEGAPLAKLRRAPGPSCASARLAAALGLRHPLALDEVAIIAAVPIRSARQRRAWRRPPVGRVAVTQVVALNGPRSTASTSRAAGHRKSHRGGKRRLGARGDYRLSGEPCGDSASTDRRPLHGRPGVG